MAADIIDAKSDSMFGLFDTNNDGTITLDDFVQRAGKITAQFPEANGDAVRDQYRRAWEQLAGAADADNDGQVSREEFDAVIASAQPGDLARAIGGNMAEFLLADTDGDGVIDRAEFAQLMLGYDLAGKEADVVFRQLDKDGDGSISHQEYAGALEEFYISDDPNAPVVKASASLIGA